MANATHAKQDKQRGAASGAATAEPEEAQGDDGQKPVAQQIREMAEQTNPATGKNFTRREIATTFGVTYQRVYQVTKDMDVFGGGEGGGGQRPKVLVEASEALSKAGLEHLVGTPRVEAIRSLYDQYTAEGVEKPLGKIARALGCSYQIVFQATKGQRAGEAGEEGDVDGELEEGEAEGAEPDDDTADEDEDEDDEDE